jgi:hypothetical protein
MAVPVVLLQGHGCRKCTGTLPKTHQTFLEDLAKVNKTVKIITEFENTTTHIIAKCTVCEHIWEVTPKNLLKGHGCPCCRKPGFKSDKDAFFYVYKFGEFYGFGITNKIKSRSRQHSKTFEEAGIEAELVRTVTGCGNAIINLESHLKRTLPIINTGIDGFKTEAVRQSDGHLLFKELEAFTNSQIDNQF